MFYYQRNYIYMQSAVSQDTIPLFWVFENFSSPHYGWTALALVATFINGIFVSLFELIAVFYYYAGEMRWLAWYANTIGWIFGVFGMFAPVTFAILQLILDESWGGLHYDTSHEFGNNTVWLIVMGIFQWFNSAVTHLFMGPRLNCYAGAMMPRNNTRVMKCSLSKPNTMSNNEY